jgi:NADPH:quinone reductase-like Zn-dependent oxidoreductase
MVPHDVIPSDEVIPSDKERPMLGYITDPAAPGGLDLRERPEPSPGPHELVVEVAAYAINRGEIALLARRSDGWAPGQDVAGVVAVAAADGTGPAVGTRVAGIADGGGWSERAVVPSHRAAALPDSVSFEAATTLGVAGLTALRALRTGGAVLGRRVLVTGASGGVGTFAVQLALAAGARVTALVSAPSRVETVKALGVEDVVTGLDESTGRFDFVLDGVGGSVLSAAIRRLVPGGLATAYGASGGERSEVAFYDFGGPGRLQAFFVYQTGEETFGEDLGTLAGFVAEGRLVPQLGLVRDWAETPQAVEALRRREVTGKVVLTRPLGG